MAPDMVPVFRRWRTVLSGLLFLGPWLGAPGPGQAEDPARYFPETGHAVSGLFWQYWQAPGGLTQPGYPLSEELPEVSELDGHHYTVQYFLLSVFERHPENAPPYDVLLAQL